MCCIIAHRSPPVDQQTLSVETDQQENRIVDVETIEDCPNEEMLAYQVSDPEDLVNSLEQHGSKL